MWVAVTRRTSETVLELLGYVSAKSLRFSPFSDGVGLGVGCYLCGAASLCLRTWWIPSNAYDEVFLSAYLLNALVGCGGAWGFHAHIGVTLLHFCAISAAFSLPGLYQLRDRVSPVRRIRTW